MLNIISISIFLLFILIGLLTIISSEFKIKYHDFIHNNKEIGFSFIIISLLSGFYIIKTDVGREPFFDKKLNNDYRIINDSTVKYKSDFINESSNINERINNLEFYFKDYKSSHIKEIEDSIKEIKSTVNKISTFFDNKDSLLKRLEIIEKKLKFVKKEQIKNRTLDCIIDRVYKVNGGGEFYFSENGILKFYTPGWFGLQRVYQYGDWNYIGGNKIRINYEGSIYILKVKEGCYIDSEDFGF